MTDNERNAAWDRVFLWLLILIVLALSCGAFGA